MKTISLVLFILISLTAFSDNEKNSAKDKQENQITGKVVDHLTGENLAGVKFQIANTDIIVYSDLDGNFSIPVPAEYAQQSIEVSYISYESVTLDQASTDQNLEIKILPVTR